MSCIGGFGTKDGARRTSGISYSLSGRLCIFTEVTVLVTAFLIRDENTSSLHHLTAKVQFQSDLLVPERSKPIH